MAEVNKSYRIRTQANITEGNGEYLTIDANLVQEYDTFDVLSVTLDSRDTYKLHNSNYGVVIGRVIANNGFGIPNAKLSIFIERDREDDTEMSELYPYSNVSSRNNDGVRYNLLPDEQVSDCHQIVGTFPNKRYVLDHEIVLEVFDKYYKYTTRTNNAGDYMFCGIPTGNHTIHMDLDLSDCGILSQRPRDFVYKGYTIEQFENPNMFKTGTTYETLSQIFTQNRVVYVQPFWGNSSMGETIGITRADIDVVFKFEPTCVFIGSVISDNSSNGITHKCKATEHMGDMDELTTGEGTIEMIRKTPGGDVEEFQIRGTQLINEDGIWCYQIPMNLDYMMTDEYGNMVPTDNPERGIPTRTRVRFRVSMLEAEKSTEDFFRAKILVPHNPLNLPNGKHEDYDYEFGTYTREDSYRDLFWNNVYSVKSYIPRFQRRQVSGYRDKNFTGIKHCNIYGSNNPMPYNNIRIKMPLMFMIICAIIKCFIFLTGVFNSIISFAGNLAVEVGKIEIYYPKPKFNWFTGVSFSFEKTCPFKNLYKDALKLKMSVLKDGLCPDLENWYFAPMYTDNLWHGASKPDCLDGSYERYDLLRQTLKSIQEDGAEDDPQSLEDRNRDEDDEAICLTIKTDYLIACIEMNLAQEYKVINFDFYNDWINGTLYFPRWKRFIRPKITFLGITFARAKLRSCMDNTKVFSKTRKLTQMCSIGYNKETVGGVSIYTDVKNPINGNSSRSIKKANQCHKHKGFRQKPIFGRNGGICHEHPTLKGQFAYYLKPCEWLSDKSGKKANLFATDIILLGSLNDCDIYGIPQAFKHLKSSSYVMPTNLALTNMDTNGPLYANGKNTICTKSSEPSYDDIKNNDKGIQVLDTTNSALTIELQYYSGGNSENYNVIYEADELSDTIALTEAAGVSWNWTGPGQGRENEAKMYQPGGHFLGISCVNSQTNLKSCLNLERVCEVGTTISQRKEDVRKISKNGDLKYTYTVPTGFISDNEVNDSDFRTMFATMNHKRLIANKRISESGYKVYDFVYMHPTNFEGGFKNVCNNASEYNTTIPVVDESSTLKKFGIGNASGRDDYDAEEMINSQTRTIEDTSLDYYMFRFGLNREDLRDGSGMQERMFMYSDGNTMYMPQFENSYYFYFGMNDGATAIDEFNKQFFSVCGSVTLVGSEASIICGNGDYDICNGTGELTISLNNIETPCEEISYENLSTNVVTNITADYQNASFIVLSGITSGEYKVKVKDANQRTYENEVKIGYDLISSSYEAVDYSTGKERSNTENKVESFGGYVKIFNLSSDGLLASGVDKIELILEDESGIQIDSVSGAEINSNKEYKLWVKSSLKKYNVFGLYDCGKGKKKSLIFSFSIKAGKSIQLCFGDKNQSGKVDVENTPTRYLKYNGLGVDKFIEDISGDEGYSGINNWLMRTSLFHRISGPMLGNKTMSTKSFATNGSKVIFGSPQNNIGILSKKIDLYSKDGSKVHTIEYPFNGDDYVSLSKDGVSYSVNGPVTYELDDENIYFPTYGDSVFGKYAYEYSAIPYNGNSVGFEYSCTINDGVYVPNNDIYEDSVTKYSLLKDGYSCAFKPLPYGDLIFGIWYKGKMYAMLSDKGIYKEIAENNGIIFPSFIYPIIKRPFYVDANFFIYQMVNMEKNPDVDGVKRISRMTRDYGYRTEVRVYNGVTFHYKFGEESTITGFDDFLKASVPKQYHDCYGLSGKSIEQSARTFDYINYELKDCSDINVYSYSITEGHPIILSSNLYETITDSIAKDFVENFYYSVEVGGKFQFVTSNNEKIPEGNEYYLCNQSILGKNADGTDKLQIVQRGYETNSEIESKPEVAEMYRSGYQFLFDTVISGSKASCEFGVVYTNKPAYDQEGEYSVAIWHKNGEIVYNVHKKDNSIEEKTLKGMGTTFKSACDKLDNGNYDIKPLRSFSVRKDVKYNNSAISWEKAVKLSTQSSYTDEIELNSARRIENGEIITMPYTTNDTIFVLGVKHGDARNSSDGDSTLYKIYPYITKMNDLREFGYGFVDLNPTSLVVSNNGGSYTVSYTAATENNGFILNIISSDFSVVTFTKTEGSTEGGVVNGTLNLTIYKNPTEENREASILFYYKDIDSAVKLPITQLCGDTDKVLSVNVETVYFDVDNGYEYIYVSPREPVFPGESWYVDDEVTYESGTDEGWLSWEYDISSESEGSRTYGQEDSRFMVIGGGVNNTGKDRKGFVKIYYNGENGKKVYQKIITVIQKG